MNIHECRPRAIVAAIAAVTATLFLASVGPVSAADNRGAKPSSEDEKAPLSGNEYVTMQPFIIPIMDERRIMRRQFVLVLALKLAREDAREGVLQRIPRIRNSLYPELYRIVAFRNEKRRIMEREALRRKLAPVALDAAGRDKVSALVVHKVFLRGAP